MSLCLCREWCGGQAFIMRIHNSEGESGMYERTKSRAKGQSVQDKLTTRQNRYLFVKRVLDLVLACGGGIVLAPFMGALALAVKLDSPGPVFFRQKRIGKNKKTFDILKFRTMRTDTPKDVPTHLLHDPEAYITRTGRFMRKYSLDELPQIFNIIKGDMSIIAPRPALWNQKDLIAERDRYGANDIRPGLTGWAQINGRDELEIEEKARLDGEYIRRLQKGGINAFLFDVKCLIGTVTSVLKHSGVVEGGTGEMRKKEAEY